MPPAVTGPWARGDFPFLRRPAAAWCEVLTPASLWESGEGVEGVMATLSAYVVSFVPWTLLQVMVHLAWSDSQRSRFTQIASRPRWQGATVHGA